MTRHNSRSLPTRVLEILEMDPDGWFTIDNLYAELDMRFGYRPHERTLRKAVHRLVVDGQVERRLELWHNYDADVVRGRRSGTGEPLGYHHGNRLVVRYAA